MEHSYALCSLSATAEFLVIWGNGVDSTATGMNTVTELYAFQLLALSVDF